MARPSNFLNLNRGCPRCAAGKNYSRIAIKWLNTFNSNIQHAENGGEYIIPTTKFRVDGYEISTNTIYEFFGDCWHGNPQLYKPEDKCHPFSDLTAKELYKNTMDRINRIKSLEYEVIYIWENDFRINNLITGDMT